jgi:hypothetical protein
MEKHRAPLGEIYEFIDNEGRANIIWTVDPAYPSINYLSGWARRADDNQIALYLWWAETGSAHN